MKWPFTKEKKKAPVLTIVKPKSKYDWPWNYKELEDEILETLKDRRTELGLPEEGLTLNDGFGGLSLYSNFDNFPDQLIPSIYVTENKTGRIHIFCLRVLIPKLKFKDQK